MPCWMPVLPTFPVNGGITILVINTGHILQEGMLFIRESLIKTFPVRFMNDVSYHEKNDAYFTQGAPCVLV